MRLEPPPQPTPYQMPKTHARVRRTVYPYQAPVGRSRVPPVRQRDVQTSSSNMDSSDQLPAAIFQFLDLGEINIALQENEVGLYIIMCSRQSLPFVVSAIYWARLGEIEPLYRLKTTTAQHQCPTRPVARTLRTSVVPYDSLYPHSPSMKMIAWNRQGAGSVTFRTHAYELYSRHRPDILIIVEPCIVKGRAQAVINTLPYTHSRRVNPTGFFGGIWLLWNESTSFSVEILTHSDHSLHALVKVNLPPLTFLFTVVYASPNFAKRKIFWNYLENLVATISLPWVLLGDFNDMTSEDEKMGGLPLNKTRIAAFL